MILLGNLHLISDSEYGTHIIYNYFDNVIDFYSDEIEIEKIINELKEKINEIKNVK